MNNIKVIITVFNAEKYIETCLSSLLNQTLKDWNCILINDASTDKTKEIIDRITSQDKRFNVIHNIENKKAIQNYVDNIPKLCNDDNDVIVSLDGDDWFYHSEVLKYIHNLYEQDSKLLLTYGQYVCASDIERGVIVKGCSKPLGDIKDVRKPGVNFSHLKTFKYKLWKQLPDKRLRRWDTLYVKRAWDQPLMLNMIELAGIDNIKYVDEILYIYNNNNSISEWRLDEQEQMKEDKFIRNQIPLNKIF